MEVNNGDDGNPKYRSRLVAREIRMAGEDTIFAPTPPLESLRIVLSYATTDFQNEPKKIYDPKSPHRMQVLAIDISRAYFNAVTPEDEPTFVEFPPEFGALLVCAACWNITRMAFVALRMAGRASIQVRCAVLDLPRGRPLRVFSDTRSASSFVLSMVTTSLWRDRARPWIGLRHR